MPTIFSKAFECAQIAYDWIWDRFGIFVGAVFIAFNAISDIFDWIDPYIPVTGTRIIWFFFAATNIVLLGIAMMVGQSSRNYQLYNRAAGFGQIYAALLIVVISIAVLATTLRGPDPYQVTSTFFVDVALLFLGVRIRDRHQTRALNTPAAPSRA